MNNNLSQEEMDKLPSSFYTQAVAIFHLNEVGIEVKQTRIADWLDVSRANISQITGRMQNNGLIKFQDNLELTEKGMFLAKTVARRHRIVERFLSEILELPWEKVYEEATKWENILSPVTEKAMLSLLGNPTTGLFGNPIPYSDYKKQKTFNLLEAEKDRNYSINNITEEFQPSNKNFIQKDFGIKTLQMMKRISQQLPSECFGMDPIKTAEILSEQNEFFYSPYTYGFSNYSRTGYRKNLLTYGNVIDLSGKGPCGTHLGGTGIAISNKSKNKELALEYSYWITGSECQQTIFYTSGGQPGNSDAWENNNINFETNNFFKNTRLTLDQAWIRPRHNGYMKFQDESGNIINEYLQSNVNEVNVIDKLKLMYTESFEE